MPLRAPLLHFFALDIWESWHINHLLPNCQITALIFSLSGPYAPKLLKEPAETLLTLSLPANSTSALGHAMRAGTSAQDGEDRGDDREVTLSGDSGRYGWLDGRVVAWMHACTWHSIRTKTRMCAALQKRKVHFMRVCMYAKSMQAKSTCIKWLHAVNLPAL